MGYFILSNKFFFVLIHYYVFLNNISKFVNINYYPSNKSFIKSPSRCTLYIIKSFW